MYEKFLSVVGWMGLVGRRFVKIEGILVVLAMVFVFGPVECVKRGTRCQ
jgi:hypothetical protein